LLKYIGYGQEQLKDRLKVEFAQHVIDPGRILIESCEPSPPVLMAAYNRVDIGLDTLPYSGGVTTCEALWMGVPTVTCPGKTFASRHALSHLTNAGLAQFVATDRSAYIDLAVRWAQRTNELAALRMQMREQVRQSPLCDAQRFADDLLDLLIRVAQDSVST
jgi:predicted O-linked N-acetylglucosamine transferase (SPINDLY family)